MSCSRRGALHILRVFVTLSERVLEVVFCGVFCGAVQLLIVLVFFSHQVRLVPRGPFLRPWLIAPSADVNRGCLCAPFLGPFFPHQANLTRFSVSRRAHVLVSWCAYSGCFRVTALLDKKGKRVMYKEKSASDLRRGAIAMPQRMAWVVFLKSLCNHGYNIRRDVKRIDRTTVPPPSADSGVVRLIWKVKGINLHSCAPSCSPLLPPSSVSSRPRRFSPR